MCKIARLVYKLTRSPLYWIFRQEQLNCNICVSLTNNRKWQQESDVDFVIFQTFLYRFRRKICRNKSVFDDIRVFLILTPLSPAITKSI